MRMKALALVALLSLGACASTTYNPVVDLRGADGGRYQQDLAECRKLSEQVDVVGDSAVNTAVGAGVGAGLGAALGAVVGVPGAGAAMGAAVGGIGTGSGSAISKNERVKQVINNCLARRGYNVL